VSRSCASAKVSLSHTEACQGQEVPELAPGETDPQEGALWVHHSGRKQAQAIG